MYCFAAATLCFVALEGASSIGGFPESFPWLAATAGDFDLSLGWNFWNQLLAESIPTHNGIIAGTGQASYPDQRQQARGMLKVETVNNPPQLDQVSKSTTLRGTRCWGRDLYLKQNKIIRNQSRSAQVVPPIARLDGTENVSGTVLILIIQARSPTAHINLLRISKFDNAELELPIKRSTSKPRRQSLRSQSQP